MAYYAAPASTFNLMPGDAELLLASTRLPFRVDDQGHVQPAANAQPFTSGFFSGAGTATLDVHMVSLRVVWTRPPTGQIQEFTWGNWFQNDLQMYRTPGTWGISQLSGISSITNTPLKLTDANGICGHSLRPPIEEAIKRLCNQFE